MSDDHPFKDLEDKENARRAAMGYGPLPKEVWNPPPLPAKMKKQKIPKKKKLEQSDSILVVNESTGEINRISAEDQAQDSQKLDQSFRERMYVASAGGAFKDRFPSITKMVNMFGAKQGDEKKEKIRQTEDLRKQAEQSQNMGFAIEKLAREQEITVKLLRQLLVVVKGRRGGSGLLGGSGSGGQRGFNLSTFLYGGLALGAATGIGAGILRGSDALTNVPDTDTAAAAPYGADVDAMGLRSEVEPTPRATTIIDTQPTPALAAAPYGADVDAMGLRPEVQPAPAPASARAAALVATPYGADVDAMGLRPQTEPLPVPNARPEVSPALAAAQQRAATQSNENNAQARILREAAVQAGLLPDVNTPGEVSGRLEGRPPVAVEVRVGNRTVNLYDQGMLTEEQRQNVDVARRAGRLMRGEERLSDEEAAAQDDLISSLSPGARRPAAPAPAAEPVATPAAPAAEPAPTPVAPVVPAAEPVATPATPAAEPPPTPVPAAPAAAASDAERLVRAFVNRERQPDRYEEVIAHLQQLPRGIPNNTAVLESRIRDYLIANPGTRQAIPVEPADTRNAEDLTGNFANINQQTAVTQTQPQVAPAPVPESQQQAAPVRVAETQPVTQPPVATPRISSGSQARITRPPATPALGANAMAAAPYGADVDAMGLKPEVPTAPVATAAGAVSEDAQRIVRAFVERERQPDRYEEVIRHLQQLPRGIPSNITILESRIRDYLIANPGTRQAILVESEDTPNAEDLTGNFASLGAQTETVQPKNDVAPAERMAAESVTPGAATTATGIVSEDAQRIVRAFVDRERQPDRYEEVITHLQRLPQGIPSNIAILESRIRDYLTANPGTKQPIPVESNDARNTEDLTGNFTNLISNRESVFGGDKHVNEVVAKQQMMSKEFENRPDMFSNRNLVIRARSVKFKGDEIEFEQPDTAAQKVGGQAPGGTIAGGGGSPLAQMFSGGGAAMEGGGGQATPQPEAAATQDLKFAPGVDKRIQKDIAEKVKETESASGKSLTITSGFRDPSRNAAAGGAKNSAHTSGKAVDIQFRGNVEDTVNLIQKASASGIGGIGVYRPGFVHLDTGPKRVWGPDYTARSIPDWAKEALQAHMTGQAAQSQTTGDAAPVASEGGGEGAAAAPSAPAATPEAPAPTAGVEVAQASVQNEVAARTPEPPSVTEVPAQSGSGSPSMQNPVYTHSVNDPGPVEPDDAAERYAKLFNIAA